MAAPRKLDMELARDPGIPHLGTCTIEMKAGTQTLVCQGLHRHYSQSPEGGNNLGVRQQKSGETKCAKYIQRNIVQL